ncbi:MAG: OmpA family protein [Deltaproteobacteria bacterium]|nr:OmpA family protein [Deltaproteobacteria bacterium]
MRRKSIKLFAACVVGWGALTSCAMSKTSQPRAFYTETQVVYFGFDQSFLHADNKTRLTALAGRLQVSPRARVLVEGHTDTVGDASYNEILAEKRARSVGGYLIQAGASPQQITFLSKGEREPLMTENSASAMNRRAEIRIHFLRRGTNEHHAGKRRWKKGRVR